MALFFSTPSLLACSLWGSLAVARTSLYTAISTELTTVLISKSQGSLHPCHSAGALIVHVETYVDTIRFLLFWEDPPSTTKSRLALWSPRAGKTYSQYHTLLNHHWGRIDSQFSSSQTAARGDQTAEHDTCNGSVAPGGHHSGWCWQASKGSRVCSCAPPGSSLGCTSYIPARKENHSLLTY